MDMRVVKSEKSLCTCYMEEHEVKTVVVLEQATFKNVKVEYRGHSGSLLTYGAMAMRGRVDNNKKVLESLYHL